MESNAHTTHQMHEKIPKAGFMQLGYFKCVKVMKESKIIEKF